VDVTDFGFAQVGAEQRVAYLVMEYLDGCTLGDVLAEEQRLPLDWTLDILEQVCSAVEEAHQQGIVHRDLKPDNIWLEPNRLGGYRVKVLDFGIAKLAEAAPGAGAREAATQLNSPAGAHAAPPHQTPAPPSGEEASTLVFGPAAAAHASGEESATRVFEPRAARQPAPRGAQATAAPSSARETRLADDPARTRRLDGQTAAADAARAQAPTAAADAALTRVGSIMGTPLYMSPEQCRGERLDARADVYSLGVIAYQMLAGRTPFEGDVVSVMRHHMTDEPRPLRELNGKVPKRVARVVMAALAKDPAARPQGAASFGNSLTAGSGGIGQLLRHALALYSEHFPVFLRLSLLAHVPVIVVAVLLFLFDYFDAARRLPKGAGVALASLLALLTMAANFFATSVISGVTTVIVTQLHLAPLRPVRLGPALSVLRRRWRPFLSTSLRVTLRMMLGFLLFLVPGLVMMIRYAFYAPVVLLEGLERKAALRRSNELSRRSRWMVIGLYAVNFVLPMVIGALAGGLALKAGRSGAHVAAKASPRIVSLLNVVIVPLISITTALLYLKLRQMGGEILRDVLERFEDDDAPRPHWQRRMRERLSGYTPRSAHGTTPVAAAAASDPARRA
jgi:serine/threonine protein kinase